MQGRCTEAFGELTRKQLLDAANGLAACVESAVNGLHAAQAAQEEEGAGMEETDDGAMAQLVGHAEHLGACRPCGPRTRMQQGGRHAARPDDTNPAPCTGRAGCRVRV
jgi:hypothetical protein